MEESSQPPPPAHPSDLVAAVVNVDKRFGSVQALHRLNIYVPRSKITVLLGPNGAGKTTAIRMITGAMTPDQGTVTVFGSDPSGSDGEQIRKRCGVVSAKPSLYDRLSGLDNLRYAAELYDLGRGSSVDSRIREAAGQFGIEHALDQQVGGYSTGMKTRLALARAILHDPDLLLLDEPTSGLDPESAQAVLAMVREMTERDRTVLMCTHLLLEAEGLADEVVVVQAGTSLMWGDPKELSRRYWPHTNVVIKTVEPVDPDQVLVLDGVVAASTTAGGIRVTLEDRSMIGQLVAALAASGSNISSVVPFDPSLEDLYFAIRQEQRIDSDAPPDPLWERAAAIRASQSAALGNLDGQPSPVSAASSPVGSTR